MKTIKTLFLIVAAMLSVGVVAQSNSTPQYLLIGTGTADSVSRVRMDSIEAQKRADRNRAWARNNSLKSELRPSKYMYTQNEQDTTLVMFSKKSQITYRGQDATFRYSKLTNPKNNKWGWASGHYKGVAVSYAGLTGTGAGQSGSFMRLDTKSLSVDINPIDLVLFSYRNFGIVTGLGIESNNFRFRDNLTLRVDENNRVVPDYSYADGGVVLDKSKLTTTYLNVPLLFEFHFGSTILSNKYEKGWVSFGLITGLRLQSYTKIKSAETGKVKNFNDFRLNNIHLGAMVSVGYSCVMLTAKYYPQSIFRKNEGPHLEQFNIGVGLTLFN